VTLEGVDWEARALHEEEEDYDPRLKAL